MATWNTVQAIRMAVAVEQAKIWESSTSNSPAAQDHHKSSISGDSRWQRLAQCESSGDWGNVNPPYYGGLQFTTSSWRAVGGSGLPSDATAGEQIHRAQRLLDLQGPGAWPRCSYVAGLR